MRCAVDSLVLSLVLLVAALAVPARGAVTTYSNKSTFLSAAGSTLLESFETVADRPLGHSPIAAPLLTLTPVSSNSDAAVRSATTGGHYATDGIKHVELGDPN